MGLDELGSAIRRVAQGGSVVDPRVVDALIESNAKQGSSVFGRLTERERAVFVRLDATVPAGARLQPLRHDDPGSLCRLGRDGQMRFRPCGDVLALR